MPHVRHLSDQGGAAPKPKVQLHDAGRDLGFNIILRRGRGGEPTCVNLHQLTNIDRTHRVYIMTARIIMMMMYAKPCRNSYCDNLGRDGRALTAAELAHEGLDLCVLHDTMPKQTQESKHAGLRDVVQVSRGRRPGESPRRRKLGLAIIFD